MAANGSEVKLQGEFLAIVGCKDANGDNVRARVKFYLSDNAPEVYLLLSALCSLCMVPSNFPIPQCTAAATARP